MTSTVLLHGFLGAPSLFAPMLDRLPKGMKMLMPTLCGHRGRPAESDSWAGEVDRIATAIRRAAFGEPATLVGYSLGGRVALGVAATHPDLVRRLVLVSAHVGLRDDAQRAERVEQDFARASRIRTLGLPAFVDEWEKEPIFQNQTLLGEEIRKKHRSMRMSHAAEGIAVSLELLSLGRMPYLGDTLVNAPFPVDLVAGENDAKFRSLYEELSRVTPALRLHIVRGCGHDLVLEAPAFLAHLVGTEEPIFSAPPSDETVRIKLTQ